MNIEDDILIERFLRNELSHEEQSKFHERLAIDTDFKKNFLFEEELFKSLNEEGDISSREKIDEKEIKEYENLFADETSQNLKKVLEKEAAKYKISKKRRIISLFSGVVAAVILVLVVLNIFNNSSINHQDLYSEYFKIEELQSFVSRGEDTQNDLVNAEVLFKENKYSESLAVFNPIAGKNKETSSLYIYRAIANAELNKFKEAEKILEELINSDLIDAEKGYWYQSLIYLKSGQSKKSKKVLQKIIDNSYYKSAEAKELLEKL